MSSFQYLGMDMDVWDFQDYGNFLMVIGKVDDRVVSFECRHGPNFLDGLPTPRRVR
jgi:hypothetical protein